MSSAPADRSPHTLARCALLCVALALVGSAEAQDGGLGSVRSGLNSPTAASLGLFGAVPVGLYTGSPSVTVPLYEAQGRDGLSLPIALRYHGSGVRVGEVAGWAGLGWALDAGGVITRSVHGLPDDAPAGYMRPAIWSEAKTMSEGAPTAQYLGDVRDGAKDSEPDDFFFSFAGRSGAFTFAPPPGGGYVQAAAYTVPASRLRVVPTVGGNGITAWTVTAEDGTVYVFGEPEWTTVETSGDNVQSYNSAWYLTEVRSASGADVITLTYEAGPTGGVVQEVPAFQERRQYACSGTGTSTSGSASTYATSTVTVQARHLRTIVTANETVTFDRASRADKADDVRLAKVRVAVGGAVRREFVLTHGYFNASATATAKRLRLDAVQEVPVDLTGITTASQPQPYRFTYDEAVALPDRASYAVDHWGLFNGRTANTSLIPAVRDADLGLVLTGADRDPNPATMTAGTLTRVTYPTGGSTEFTWEPHDYLQIGTSTSGVTEAVLTHDAGTQFASASRYGLGVSGCPFTVNAASAVGDPYTGQSYIPVTVRLSVQPDGCNPDTDPTCITPLSTGGGEVSTESTTGGSCQSSSWAENGAPTVSIRAVFSDGTTAVYTHLAAQSTGDLPVRLPAATATYYVTAEGAKNTNVAASVTWRDVIPQSEAVSRGLIPYQRAVGGGVRVARVRTVDPVGGATQTTRYEYRDRSDDQKSSGVLVSEPIYVFNLKGTCSMLSHSSQSRAALGSTQGSPVGYGAVRVVQGASGTADGWTWHTFRTAADPNADDRVATGTPAEFAPLARRVSRDWKRGQEVRAEVFSGSGALVSKTETTYAFRDENTSAPGYAYAPSVFVWPLASWTPPDGQPVTFSAYGTYDVLSVWTYPTQEVATSY